MFYPDKANKIQDIFYDQTKQFPLSPCIAEVFAFPSPTNGLKTCEPAEIKLHAEIIPLEREWAVVITPSGLKTHLVCSDTA